MACLSKFDVNGCGCGSGGLACSPCAIPFRDLTLNLSSHTVTVFWNGSTSAPTWVSAVDPISSTIWTVSCSSGVIKVTWSGGTHTNTGGTCSPFDVTFNPFGIVWHLT